MSSAPPQTPEAQAQARALATTQGVPQGAQDVTLMRVAGNESIERFETVITIPADYQYRIPIKGLKNADGSWNNDAAKVGLLSDAYDYLNRVVGVTFFLPPTIHDEHGQSSPNPIHRGDYTFIRLGAVWYNPMGQMVMAVEDVEVDFQRMWMESRVNSKSAKVQRGPDGQLLFDDFGNPVVVLNDEDELQALKDLYRNRSNGLRYTYTVARTRLMKLATGIRSLPLNHPTNFQVRVVGFRDYLRPEARVAKVAGDAAALFGQAPDIEPLPSSEMGETERLNATDDGDTQTAGAAEPKSDPPKGGPAAVPGVRCDIPEPDVPGSFCEDFMDAEGKHPAGPHHYTSGGLGPR